MSIGEYGQSTIKAGFIVSKRKFVATSMAEDESMEDNVGGLNISYSVLSHWCSFPNAISPRKAGASLRHFHHGTRNHLLIIFSVYTYNVGLRKSVSDSVQRSPNLLHHKAHHQETPNCHLSEQSQTCQENISFSIIQTHTEDHDSQESPSCAILEGHRLKRNRVGAAQAEVKTTKKALTTQSSEDIILTQLQMQDNLEPPIDIPNLRFLRRVRRQADFGAKKEKRKVVKDSENWFATDMELLGIVWDYEAESDRLVGFPLERMSLLR
ncbi:uncharacterized protein B0J16DRAFT_369902 [Fusarium flagelliforme]|uniref:uncharacterized protein n=1 Tax=Fusarium flagelliforme TaxID=2675880 RepID=UPI001E8CFC06|nr:uncharacterized protein B0J16DRAFT_369902 [Fusarium flagelliforme]KAH7193831.1 hypothetical protein B0J16DRAFT_369902 [Fusarium flagelliforme]